MTALQQNSDSLAKVIVAETEEDIASVKAIFQAFVEFLPIDLVFQGIDDEMARFPDGYVLLLLAKRGDTPVGAVALKEHDQSVCEMKRLFVLPKGQGSGAGRMLCEELLTAAKGLGYQTMLLDSLRRLKAAVALYEKLGFKEIAPYNFNPEEDVVYMSRDL